MGEGRSNRQATAEAQRPVGGVGKHQAKPCHDDHRQPDAEEVVEPEDIEEHDEQVGAEHGEFPLPEVHHARGPDQQHEAEGHQRIDRADAQALEDQLEEITH